MLKIVAPRCYLWRAGLKVPKVVNVLSSLFVFIGVGEVSHRTSPMYVSLINMDITNR